MKFMDQLLRFRLDGHKPGIVRVAIGGNPEPLVAHEVHISDSDSLDTLDLRPLYGLHLAVTFCSPNSNIVPDYLEAILKIQPLSVVAIWKDSETGECVFRRWNPQGGWSDIPILAAA